MGKSVLIVAAHPDDEVLGCGATAAKLIREGNRVVTLILGEGKTSRLGDIIPAELEALVKEAEQANGVLGISEVHFAAFPDNRFDSVDLLDIVQHIEQVIAEVKPEIVFTHHGGDMNIDHQITYQAVLTATRPLPGEGVRKIYTFEIPSSTEWNAFDKEQLFIPNTFIDVSETIDQKVEAMACYVSELREYPHPRSLQHIRELARVNGTKVGLACSENFRLVRSIGGMV